MAFTVEMFARVDVPNMCGGQVVGGVFAGGVVIVDVDVVVDADAESDATFGTVNHKISAIRSIVATLRVWCTVNSDVN